MIRIFDIILSLFGIFILFPFCVLIFIVISLNGNSPIFSQKRVGKNQKPFTLYKFRTMPIDTKETGTHLVKNLKLSPLQFLLRKYKIDEIPQLINVLRGDMSFVGPRPCLLNQQYLINERKKKGLFAVRPGITGLSQIKNITMAKPTLLTNTDLEMIKKMNFTYYIYLIVKTILKIFFKYK